MNKKDIEQWILQNEEDMFEFFGISHVTGKDEEEMYDWMKDHIRKSTMFDYLDPQMVDMADDMNCHFTAWAIASLIEEEG